MIDIIDREDYRSFMKRFNWGTIFWGVAFLTLFSIAQAGLIPCPDCNKQVSDRALMCPSCGCPLEALRVAAQSNKTVRAELPFFCHSLVRVSSDQGEGVGVCIEAQSKLYVLISQSLLAGAQSLSLVKVLDNQSVSYTAIELASDRALARLAISATNLYPVPVTDENNASLALVHVVTNNSVMLVQTAEIPNRLPLGTPLLDSSTNLVMVVTSENGKHADTVASVTNWVTVQPLAFRTQTSLLRNANKRSDRSILLKQLQETKWLTPYLASEADILIKELQMKKE
jgi:hypothetical protein